MRRGKGEEMRKVGRILILIFVLLLTGCQEKESYHIRKQEEAPEKPVSLEVFAWEDEEENLRALAEAYMEEREGVSVEVNIIPATEYPQQMMGIKNNVQSGDVILFSNIAEPAVWIEKGVLQSLAPWIDEAKENYGIWHQEEDAQYSEYMRPYRKSRWAVYYNRDLFDLRGVPYPEEGWTWEDYAETAVRLTGQVGMNKIYGSLSYAPDNKWWRVPARTAGANNPLHEDELELFMEAARWCYELTYNLGAQVPYQERVGNIGVGGEEIFLEGNTGMFFSGDWSAAVLNEMIAEYDLDITYDIAPMPRWSGRPYYSVSDAAVAAMTATTLYPEEAWSFIRFISGKEGAKILAQRGLIPAWDSDEIRQVYMDSMEYPEHLEYFFEEGRTSSVPADVSYAEAIDIVEDEIALYLLQEKSLAKCEEDIREAIEPLVIQENPDEK